MAELLCSFRRAQGSRLGRLVAAMKERDGVAIGDELTDGERYCADVERRPDAQRSFIEAVRSGIRKGELRTGTEDDMAG